ncbi:hypothetical protein [Siphonobacter sp. SORGH_AS_0500]|uniref:hypothetical protein n=1 Tax=Siphonobacter sp. SORGH_AS_0500 TaxID=1864824 RepID=UPI00286A7E59|nr:hypothetical protein [Siphonobacter sp. SORGH_AS_0500]
MKLVTLRINKKDSIIKFYSKKKGALSNTIKYFNKMIIHPSIKQVYSIYIVNDKYFYNNIISLNNISHLNMHTKTYLNFHNKDSVLIISRTDRSQISLYIFCNELLEKEDNSNRIFLSLAKTYFLCRGFVPFHASACSKNGHSIVLLGNPGAGKTTTLLNLIINNQYDYVCNSELYICVNKGDLIGISLPKGITIRKPILEIFPTIDLRNSINENTIDTKKLLIKYNNIKFMFNCNTISYFHVNHIFWVQFNSNIFESKIKKLSLKKTNYIINFIYNSKLEYEPLLKILILKNPIIKKCNDLILSKIINEYSVSILEQGIDSNQNKIDKINNFIS